MKVDTCLKHEDHSCNQNFPNEVYTSSRSSRRFPIQQQAQVELNGLTFGIIKLHAHRQYFFCNSKPFYEQTVLFEFKGYGKLRVARSLKE